jgi:hypothetical protein
MNEAIRETGEAQPVSGGTRIRLPRLGLSGQLLVLTVVFVMLAEVLIYVPSIANFRLNWLNDRLAAAYTAALVLDAAPSGTLPESLAQQTLDSVGAKSVAMKVGEQRLLLAVAELPTSIDHEVDVRTVSWYSAIVDAFGTLFGKSDDVMRVVGAALLRPAGEPARSARSALRAEADAGIGAGGGIL